MARPTDLDATLSADGQSSAVYFPGGSGVLLASGTFGSGTLTVQWQDDAGTWFSSSATLAAAGHVAFVLPQGPVRLDLSGSTSPSITARVRAIHDV